MFVRKMHEEQTKRGKKHNGGSDDQSCFKKSIEIKEMHKNYSIFLWPGLIQIDDIVSFDFQNLQYLISLLA